MKDMKEGLSSARKADITHVRGPFLVYTSRPCEYGSDKYERGNFLRPASADPAGSPAAIRAAFIRFRNYLRADLSHTIATLDSMERHLAGDPHLEDVEGMKRAAYAADTDATPGAKVGASLLPHVAHGCASKMMAVTQAVDAGLLPADPGTPWRDAGPPPEKDTEADCGDPGCCGGRDPGDEDDTDLRADATEREWRAEDGR